MQDVSCRPLQLILRAAKRRGIDAQTFLSGTRYSLEYLRNSRNFIDWTTFAQLLRNLSQSLSREEFVSLGREFTHSPFIRPLTLVARLLFSPRDFYRWAYSAGSPSTVMFPCVRTSYLERSPGSALVILEVDERYQSSEEFFLISQGAMAELPRLLALKTAQVELTIIGNRATYEVTYPKGGGLLSFLWRMFLAPISLVRAGSELKSLNETLALQVGELQTSRAVVREQAHQLETLSIMGRELAKHTEMEPLADALSSILLERVRTKGVRLWVQELDQDAERCVGEWGDLTASIHRFFPLTNGEEKVGRLEVWGAMSEQVTGFIEELVPWAAIAVENARVFDGLRTAHADLEKKVVERTQALEASLTQLNHVMRQRTEFFANVSHELRTPLTLLLGTIDALLSNQSLDLATRDQLSPAARNGYRLLRLVNELLDTAKIDDGRLSLATDSLDLTQVAQEAVKAFRRVLEERHVELRLEASKPVVLLGDPERLEQVALNLVSNAARHVPDGGWIRVAVDEDPEHERATLVVENNGEGIDIELLPRLFERFAQPAGSGRRRYGTSGLGLPLSRSFVQLHGGDITVENLPGSGVRFTVWLPRRAVGSTTPLPRHLAPASVRELRQYGLDEAAPASGSPPPAAHASRSAPDLEADIVSGRALGRYDTSDISKPLTGERQPVLLIVEDNPELLDFLSRQLGSEFRVETAADGKQGLTQARELLPDIILSDMMMPGLTGLELCKALKAGESTRGIPFVLLSARGEVEDRLTGLDQGADDYQVKPFNLRELKARLRAHVRVRLLTLKLSESERLSSLGTLVAGVAHELRNPLNGIINALAPVREALPASAAKARELADIALESSRRVERITQQLLLHARAREGQLGEIRPLDVVDSLSSSLRLIQHAYRDSAQVELRVEGEAPVRALGEAGALSQIWTNLVANAVQAAGKNGHVWIDVRRDGDGVRVDVQDDGPGVPERIRGRIFEPFFTTKGVGQGSGLGLSITRELVKELGGDLALDPSHAKGARFTVRLRAP